jgi:hypothetical protein
LILSPLSLAVVVVITVSTAAVLNKARAPLWLILGAAVLAGNFGMGLVSIALTTNNVRDALGAWAVTTPLLVLLTAAVWLRLRIARGRMRK